MINLLKKIYRRYNKNRVLYNVNGSQHKKNALVSYITHPYRRKNSNMHTNIPESLAISKCFDELEYNCDVIDNNSNKKINYDKYDVVFGFGNALENSFDAEKKLTRIYYGTGKHPYFSNIETIKRGLDFKQKKGSFLTESLRVIKEDYALQTTAPDALIIIGGETESLTYKKYTNLPIHNINVSFFKIHEYSEIIKNKDFFEARNNFLFFSGGGLIHKGLDLLLDVFSKQRDLHLHICAPLYAEKRFNKIYQKELFENDHIHTYGFINLESDVFKTLISKCAFVILPSCSEAMPTSVVNVVGNGGLIPILSHTALIGIDEFTILINELTSNAIVESIKYSQSIIENELMTMSMKIGETVNKNYTMNNYSVNLENIFERILYKTKIKAVGQTY